jgi:hypothetical protein
MPIWPWSGGPRTGGQPSHKSRLGQTRNTPRSNHRGMFALCLYWAPIAPAIALSARKLSNVTLHYCAVALTQFMARAEGKRFDVISSPCSAHLMAVIYWSRWFTAVTEMSQERYRLTAPPGAMHPVRHLPDASFAHFVD